MQVYLIKNSYLILFFILLISLFFRSYQIIDRLSIGHDSDLLSWIVKDIVINHHFRLIGQLTSAPGIFIGPLFYYAMVPFYLLTNMDPIGGIIPIIILGVLTTFSYFFVFTKLFNSKIGLMSSFLEAISLGLVNLDREIVPTTPTNMWSVWYLYTIINISRGNFSVLPLLGLLIGLIWHIHIALVPILIAIPISFILSKKLPNFKQIIIFFLVTFFSLSPFMVFEIRHNFSQTKSLIGNFSSNFNLGSSISENREIYLGRKNENGKLNLDQKTHFMIDIIPEEPKVGDEIDFNIAVKNHKYSALTTISLDCGYPQKFEVPYYIAKFKWSTKDCKDGKHYLIASAKTKEESFLEKNINKLKIVLEKENTNIINLFITPINLPPLYKNLLIAFMLLSPLICWILKSLKFSEILIIYSWIVAVFAFFTVSSVSISEYYLASINVILILTTSIFFIKILQKGNLGKVVIILLLALLLFKNLFYFVFQNNYKKGYLEKNAVVNYIKENAIKEDYPCIGISYITSPGEDVGFRYLFYLAKVHLVAPSTNVPTYDIVIPDELSNHKTSNKFGHIGVISPSTIPSKEVIEESCKKSNINLTDSMFGYVE